MQSLKDLKAQTKRHKALAEEGLGKDYVCIILKICTVFCMCNHIVSKDVVVDKVFKDHEEADRYVYDQYILLDNNDTRNYEENGYRVHTAYETYFENVILPEKEKE